MAINKASADEKMQRQSSEAGTKTPYPIDDIIAWEPADNDLWIPYRIRGSWRGGVLG